MRDNIITHLHVPDALARIAVRMRAAVGGAVPARPRHTAICEEAVEDLENAIRHVRSAMVQSSLRRAEVELRLAHVSAGNAQLCLDCAISQASE